MMVARMHRRSCCILLSGVSLSLVSYVVRLSTCGGFNRGREFKLVTRRERNPDEEGECVLAT
jgi:hypothetical protein